MSISLRFYSDSRRGYTLLEMMLVVLLIGLIAISSFSTLERYQKERAVQQSAKQVQNLLQAAIKYHANQDEWPYQIQDLVDNGYIDAPQLCSSWQKSHAKDSVCHRHATYFQAPFPGGFTAKTAKYYGISLLLHDSNIVNRIAVTLPTAILTQGHTVTVYTAAFTTPKNDKGWIVSAGIADSGDRIEMPKCPHGFEGHFLETLQYFATDQRNADEYFTLRYTVLGEGVVYDEEQDRHFIYPAHHTQKTGTSPSFYTYFMTLCLTNGNWHAQQELLAGSKQCGSDWLNYNKGSRALPC